MIDMSGFCISDQKPRGLWYELDGSWEEWCKDEMPEWWAAYNFSYLIEPISCKILRITSSRELVDFTTIYKDVKHPYGYGTFFIKWNEVANEYDGIEISPYLWGHRLNFETRWHSGWDCASGCIWRPSAVKIIEMSRL